MDPEQKQLDEKLQERFKQLPPVVQNAITSAEVEKHLRELGDRHKLHLDQWETLENEVMLTLLGFQPAEDLAQNLQSEVGVDSTTAKALATDISNIVFEPIRLELEQQLQHPNTVSQAPDLAPAGEQASRAPSTPIEKVSSEDAGATVSSQSAPSVAPATPPPPSPTEKAPRAPVSETYKPGEPSVERKDVHSDPYREPPA